MSARREHRRRSGGRRPHRALRRALVLGSVAVVVSSIVTLAFASRRIVSEEAAFQAPSTGRCEASRLNRSAVLPGTHLAVSPLPGSYAATTGTQISMLGAPPSAISDVRVRGSRSGTHSGRMKAYSQGDGASFLTSRPFQAGETVTVRGRVKVGKHVHSFVYYFVIAREDVHLYTAKAHAAGGASQMQHFRSRPELQPPSLVVTASSPQAERGYIFAAPYSGPGPAGPMIFDESGNLVWFDPLHGGDASANLQVQQVGGNSVLTWWQGHITTQGFGRGEEMIYDGSYRQIGRVHAGNGLKADLHEFHLTDSNTALVTVFNPILCDLSRVGGPHGGAVTDTIAQEIDVRTGLVRRDWHSLDHVPMSDSYSSATHASPPWPMDYFHLNSIDQMAGDRTLISARNTWALYELNTTTGQIVKRIGGRRSTVKLGSGAGTAFQHDATKLSNGTISIFDNGAVPKVHPQSRAIVVSLNAAGRSVNVLREYEHPGRLSSGSQGNVQALDNGDLFIGWGSEPYFSEFDAAGALVFDAHMHGSYESYRGYRFAWTGAPREAPSIAAAQTSASAPVTAWASWNGDTRTASWRLLAGASPQQLAPVATAPRRGFETSLTTPSAAAYVAVQALDAAGNVLGTSRAIKG